MCVLERRRVLSGDGAGERRSGWWCGPACPGAALTHQPRPPGAWEAARTVNTELIGLYWQIGRAILDRQASQGWGAKVISRLAADLCAEFPVMRGFSQRNLVYMRTFAAAFPESEQPITQQAVARLPWGHVTVLLDRVGESTARLVCRPGCRTWLVPGHPDPPHRLRPPRSSGSGAEQLFGHLAAGRVRAGP